MTLPAPDLIDLSAPRVRLATSVPVREAAKAALDAGATHYTDRPGVLALREALAVRLAERNGIAVRAEGEVVVTCGEQEALFVAMTVLVGAGDEVVIPGPALPEDLALVRMVGGAPRVAPPDAQLGLDPDGVVALITPATRVLLLRSPSPAGVVIPIDVVERLGELAVAHDLKVVAVESLEGLRAADAPPSISIASVEGLAPRTATINGFAAAGLDGWRVGYVAGQSELLAPMMRLKQELSICSPAVSQHAALWAMGGIEAVEAAAAARLDERRAALTAALEAGGVAHLVADAGGHVLLRPGEAPPAGTDPLALARAAGVALASGDSVGAAGWLRAALDVGPERLAEAAARLAVALAPTATAGSPA
jgi:aspartate/methionine/tyrosine aminotransferase